ncbi:MAG: RluA family pseudouridine synthase [Treponema sp.]|nr:RluA family pseudouridine synthase [Treponema sp.]
MYPPFNEADAYEFCLDIANEITLGMRRIENITQVSEERKNSGVMIGALIASDSDGIKKKLFTLSGTSKKIVSEKISADEIYVEPIVSPEKIAEALRENDAEIHRLTDEINFGCENSAQLKAERKELTTQSLQKVFDLYSFNCIDGNTRSLNSICKKKLKGNLPPTGTGECCEPKLLSYAFKNKLTPLSMAQIFYGEKSESVEKKHLEKYPPCDERCGIILPYMLDLEILYRDEHIVVVNKPSGLLSVPGRGEDKQDCVVNRIKRLYPQCIEQPSVHRLDMETSGILVLAFTKEAHKNLSRQFEEGLIEKEYIALLDGITAKKGIAEKGESELYFRLDVDNRPHQIWDEVYGKKAVTRWQILGVENYESPDGLRRAVTRVKFLPQTGRTHQLRLASSDSHGFGIPIVGDTLYGKCQKGERLMLHASYIKFVHPVTGKEMEFSLNPDF